MYLINVPKTDESIIIEANKISPNILRERLAIYFKVLKNTMQKEIFVNNVKIG